MTMRKATVAGKLTPINDCEIIIPHTGENDEDGIIVMRNLPDISDSKTAVYNNEGIIGRSFPLYTYSHSSDRTINIQIHFFIVEPGDGAKNLKQLRMLQSAVYPREGNMTEGVTYKPPPICRIRCGNLLAITGQYLCVVLQSYSVKFPTDVAWDEETLCPYRFDVDTTWLTVYSSEELPWQSNIFKSGR